MSSFRIPFKKYYCLISAIVISLCSISVYAIVPLDAEVTVDNILEYADEYDPDGAFILREGIEFGDDILDWYLEEDGILDSYDTAVHEECHTFTWALLWGSMQYYIGNGESIEVTEGAVYDTVEMAREMPEQLRTFRYNDYIGEQASDIMSSRQFGVYGLLNEYNAYSWGMNAAIRMYDYLDDADAAPDLWENTYLLSGYNNMMAQSEFDFWILRYLIYAKENEPSVYEDTLENKDFTRAYLTIRERYQGQIREFMQSLPDLVDLLNSKGHDVEVKNNSFYIHYDDGSSYSTTIVDEEQKMLEEEIKKPEYQEMLREIESADGGTYEWDEDSGTYEWSEEGDPAEEDEDAVTHETDDDNTPAEDDRSEGILQQIWNFIKALPGIVIGFFKSLPGLLKPVIGFFKSLWRVVSGFFSGLMGKAPGKISGSGVHCNIRYK